MWLIKAHTSQEAPISTSGSGSPNTMVPTMLVGGFTTVTLGSVVFAGILTNFLWTTHD